MKNKILKYGLILAAVGVVAGAGVALFIFKSPHRDVQAANIDFELTATDLVNEYLANGAGANDKYLQEEGESKILAVTGTIKSISTNLENNYVLLLQDDSKSGVRCTFTTASNANAKLMAVGQKATIKGVIRSGATYDEDLELYEDVVLHKCDIL